MQWSTAGLAATPQNAVPAASDRPLAREGEADLTWIEPAAPAFTVGATLGVPWPRGLYRPGQPFTCITDSDQPVPTQSWTLATWPDGSLKWSAHAVGPDAAGHQRLLLKPGEPSAPPRPVTVQETDAAIDVDTGVIRCRIPRQGDQLIESIERDGQPMARGGRLVGLRQDQPESTEETPAQLESFTSRIESATVEQNGPARTAVRIEGTHRTAAGRDWLPFTVRLYFHAGGDAVRMMHTFIFDGDEQRDFLRGLGVRFDVPMRDALHDRHVRLAGEGRGLFTEAVRGITGLRRDPGEEVRRAQVEGRATPPIESWDSRVSSRLELIPAWNDYTLSQLSADGFQIRKRTKPGHGWIAAGAGRRASGVGYVGGPSGGLAFGLRDFWQRHPTQIDIRNAAADDAEVTLWLWSPDAPAMDLRFYHDGMGMDTFPEQIEGLNITYEDYEPGFGTPHGIARTNELVFRALPHTPSGDELADFVEAVRTPPQLAASPAHILHAGVFGGLWSLPDRSTPARARIEDQLQWYLDYYRNQTEQHRWYGFWDHGDVMHTYDPDRHVWRYDVGGYAWDNSELSPDLWLWYAFLRSGDADAFRFAEAMTRHTGEVDVYHLGRFKDLGTRHNVQHWGCSAKQLRISTAAYRRFYYFLTADERVGDLMRALVDADETFLHLDPIRKIRQEPYQPEPRALAVGFGTDWGSLAAAWLTEWERTGDEKVKEKLVNSMRTIGQMPFGFFTSGALFDPVTGKFTPPENPGIGVSHLSAVFGLVEICAELIQNFDVPEFEAAWLQYCELYSADREERAKVLGENFRSGGLTANHSRLTAWAARRKNDSKLAERAWNEFFSDGRWAWGRYSLKTDRIEGPASLNPVDEARWVSTNDTAQWSLSAMQCLALVGDHLPPDDPRTRNDA